MTHQCNQVTSAYHCAQGLQFEWCAAPPCAVTPSGMGCLAVARASPPSPRPTNPPPLPRRWGLWFAFFLLVAILVSALRHSLHRHRLTLMAFIVMSSLVLMENISSYLYEVSGQAGGRAGGKGRQGAGAGPARQGDGRAGRGTGEQAGGVVPLWNRPHTRARPHPTPPTTHPAPILQADFVNTVAGDLRHANNAAACGCVIIQMCYWTMLIVLGDMGGAAGSDMQAWEAGAQMKDGALSASA